ncbi:MAG: 2TM domain-containing protein [Candidatus Kapabacteria bacterium]|jgi:hypothetical protein|nr:2TM domain-containing protein [Candidatus Kapabacteria bacterium]
MGERIFSSTEIDRIIKRAISRSAEYSGGITESELLKIAAELNLSREQILAAIKEDNEMAGFEEAKRMWIEKKKHSFKEHLTAYLIINTFLCGINFFTSGTINWAFFSLLGWGIGLAFDYMDSYHPNPDKVEAGAKKIMKTNKWKNLFENVGFSILQGFQKK